MTEAELSASFSGKWSRLEAVGPQYYGFLYDLAMTEANLVRWRYRGKPVTPKEFVEGLWNGVLSQFVVVSKRRNIPIGHVVAYNADIEVGHFYVGGLVLPRYQRTGISQDAFEVFFRYLSSSYLMQKYYMEIPAFNMDQFPQRVGRAVELEACLKDFVFYDGRYWDWLIYVGRMDTESVSEVRARGGGPG